MKIKLALVAASLGLSTPSALGAQEARAVEINILGLGPAIDERAFSEVRTLIAREVVDNNVTRFIVGGFGVEGGFSACVELRDEREARNLQARLGRVRPDPSTTSYSLRRMERCDVR
jgi:hypothetical protein